MLIREDKAKIIEMFRKNQQDTGSMRVQVGILTEEIKMLTSHCDTHPKDFSTRRGLLNKVSRRKKFLYHLEQEMDTHDYERFIQQLGIRK